MIPTAVGADLHRAVAGTGGVPCLDRRELARREQLGRLGQRKLRKGFGKRRRGGDHRSDIGVLAKGARRLCEMDSRGGSRSAERKEGCTRRRGETGGGDRLLILGARRF